MSHSKGFQQFQYPKYPILNFFPENGIFQLRKFHNSRNSKNSGSDKEMDIGRKIRGISKHYESAIQTKSRPGEVPAWQKVRKSEQESGNNHPNHKTQTIDNQ